eukprot:7379602-Prymnesium_polylepis.1
MMRTLPPCRTASTRNPSTAQCDFHATSHLPAAIATRVTLTCTNAALSCSTRASSLCVTRRTPSPRFAASCATFWRSRTTGIKQPSTTLRCHAARATALGCARTSSAPFSTATLSSLTSEFAARCLSPGRRARQLCDGHRPQREEAGECCERAGPTAACPTREPWRHG